MRIIFEYLNVKCQNLDQRSDEVMSHVMVANIASALRHRTIMLILYTA